MAVALVAALTAGCAPRAKPESLPPQTVTQAAPEPPPPSEPPVAAPVKDATVIVIDPGGETAAASPSLAEAARAERERRRVAGKPAIEINNRNLPQYATGQLTTATPANDPPPPAAAVAAEPERGEAYWRARALDIRRRWRQAFDTIPLLEGEVGAWRQRFYAEDDPYVRDGQLKPEWDRALERLETTRTQAAAAEEELADLLEEGHRAGALTAWLDEGLELEPPPPAEQPAAAEPGEPGVIEPVEPPR